MSSSLVIQIVGKVVFCLILLSCSGYNLVLSEKLTVPRPRLSRKLKVLGRIRGGASFTSSNNSPYELNPQYESSGAVTLGDLERPNGYQPSQPMLQQQPSSTRTHSSTFTWQGNNNPSQSSLFERIQIFANNLHQASPTLSAGLWTCISIFILWRIPLFQGILQRYFVCSRYNVIRNHRYPALLLSAISHVSLTHLAVNMLTWLNMGPQLRRDLVLNGGWPLWPLVLGSALSGSLLYLLFTKDGGCLGLSGVTLAFLAVTARMYPNRDFTIGRIFPVRVPAEIALGVFFLWSLLGSLAPASGGGRTSVAHAAHLGGILFGTGYYELWNRRLWLQQTTHKLKGSILKWKRVR
mmetsp:Transcript_28123/g.39555  ORF Transcript_28123/g.39555 Transcript_28123/m.39555 type:complete len:351 (-) Transcript_28123:32-1084(-)